MEICFKKDWSKRIDFEDEESFFAGRENEINHLKSYIINNSTGSILLSGQRGVGISVASR